MIPPFFNRGKTMRISEVIGSIDKKYPNIIDSITKIRWLKALDMQIKEEVIDTHKKPDDYEEPDFNTYDMDTELLIGDIYAEIYESYLKMKISQELVEQERYAMETTVFNNLYITYQAYYNRHHMPLVKAVPVYR